MILPISHLNHEVKQMDINLKADIQSTNVSEKNMEKVKLRKRETSHNIEFNIYKILFLSIKCIAIYTRFLSIIVFQWHFWIWFQLKNIFDLKIKNKSSVIKKNIDCTYIKPPQEITVVLNETNLKEREVYDLFYLIAEFFSSIKVGKLNFYQQKGNFLVIILIIV